MITRTGPSRRFHPGRDLLLGILLSALPVLQTAAGQSADSETVPVVETVELAPIQVGSSRVAITEPAGSFPTIATALRYEPLVDAQSRGPAESQSDLTIRGGTFDNTSLAIGVLPFYDPQTGHYAGELPFDPEMLSGPVLTTGPDQAWRGFNATAGGIEYDWRPIVANGGVVEVAGGNHALFYQRLLVGGLLPASSDPAANGPSGWCWQLGAARSESNGPIDWGDHLMKRAAGRLSWVGERRRTEIFAGYLDKFIGWPGAYTGNPTLLETDHTKVLAVGIEHREDYGAASFWKAGGLWRRLDDNYELDRFRPGYFRPYEHRTQTGTAAAEGRHGWADDFWRLHWRAVYVWDNVRSTDLVYAGFQSRGLWKVTVAPEWRYRLTDRWSGALLGGLAWDGADQSADALSPLAQWDWTHRAADGRGSETLRLGYSRTSQVPGYTALASNPAPGAFAGNAALGRSTAQTYEAAIIVSRERWRAQSGPFFRKDRHLTDWTYASSAPRTLRQANPVDLQTWGWETYVSYGGPRWQVQAGHTWLQKQADYGGAAVDASYYALNFPRHRATAGLSLRPFEQWTLRADAEYRRQFPNARRTSSHRALQLSASVQWQPTTRLTCSLTADNLTNNGFQDFPGVPAAARQITLQTQYRW